jgi:glucose/arabinose dehydrogenase
VNNPLGKLLRFNADGSIPADNPFGTPDPSGPGGYFAGIAITGGAFYPAAGPFPAAYRGSCFFADLGSRFIARVDIANGNAAYAFASIGDAPVGMLAGADGALYALGRGSITRISSP